MLVTAAWLAAFALPVLVAPPPPADLEPPVQDVDPECSAVTASCGRICGEWRRDPNVVYYLIASAVFRDGLAGVFHVRRRAGRQSSTASPQTTCCCSG